MSGVRAPLSNAALQKAWTDPAETVETLRVRFGCSYARLARRAAVLGLPPRTKLHAVARFKRDDLFAAMWQAGVLSTEMARHYGVDRSVISRSARSMGLSPRDGGRSSFISFAEFAEVLVAARMAAARKVEIAVCAGRDVPAAVDMAQLFPEALNRRGGAAREWAALHANGLTAAEAADRRGRTTAAARGWARSHGLRWKQAAQGAAA